MNTFQNQASKYSNTGKTCCVEALLLLERDGDSGGDDTSKIINGAHHGTFPANVAADEDDARSRAHTRVYKSSDRD